MFKNPVRDLSRKKVQGALEKIFRVKNEKSGNSSRKS